MLLDLAEAHLESLKYLHKNESNFFELIGNRKRYFCKELVKAFEKANGCQILFKYVDLEEKEIFVKVLQIIL